MTENEIARSSVPVYRDPQHVISVFESTVLTYSSHAPNPRFLEAWTRAVELVVRQAQGGLLAITIINRHARAPDEASKAHIRHTVLRHAAEIDAFAYVVEGEGFGAAAVRSALSLICLAARYPFPLRVFGRVEDAVPWMLNRPTQRTQRSSAIKLIDVANSLHGELLSGALAT